MEPNFATTAEQRINEMRHVGVRLALVWLVNGHTSCSSRSAADLAFETLFASVLEQARIAGVRVCEAQDA